MNDGARKLIVAYCALCVLVTSSWCFHKHIETSSKVGESSGKKQCADENDTPPPLKINHATLSVAKQQFNTDSNKSLRIFFGVDWGRVSKEISNNWWIIALSLLLPLIVFWRIQHSMRKRLQEWKRLFIRKEKAYNFSRRLTLPDLTLAKHARRESLAESTVKLSNHPRKLSQLLRNTKQNLFERSDDTPGETKRVHKIRRPH